ncbi:MAG: hypothetical protein QXM76_05600, partial [Zestosphaera sp.]
ALKNLTPGPLAGESIKCVRVAADLLRSAEGWRAGSTRRLLFKPLISILMARFAYTYTVDGVVSCVTAS